MKKRKKNKVRSFMVIIILVLATYGGFHLFDKYNRIVSSVVSDQFNKANKAFYKLTGKKPRS